MADQLLVARATHWLVAGLLPIALLGGLLQVMLTGWWVATIYSVPGFPGDFYGFPPDQRQAAAIRVIDWVCHRGPDTALLVARFPPGAQAPERTREDYADGDLTRLFSDRAQFHLSEVRPLMDRCRWLGNLAVVLVAGGVAWLGLAGGRRRAARAVLAGAWWTWGLLAGIGVLLAVAFNPLFEAFHRALFTGDTFILDWADTLIRCFPAQFWAMSGGLLVGGTLGAAVLVGVVGHRIAVAGRSSAAVSGWAGWSLWPARIALALAAIWFTWAMLIPVSRVVSMAWWPQVPATITRLDADGAEYAFLFSGRTHRGQVIWAVDPWSPTAAMPALANIRSQAMTTVDDIDPDDAVLWPGFAPGDLWRRLAATLPPLIAAGVWWWRISGPIRGPVPPDPPWRPGRARWLAAAVAVVSLGTCVMSAATWAEAAIMSAGLMALAGWWVVAQDPAETASISQ
ncbi:hypothetical protein LBMAG53_21030 [Planctomycetota bacterium]|nr:hypothetical protein LBMAG53_21030 [Planctomycetota bacterium]